MHHFEIHKSIAHRVSRMRYHRIARPLLLLFALLLLFGCYADPTLSDVDRVKRQFLVLRFHAPFDSNRQRISDQQLFEESCRNHRVRCDRILDLLREEDRDFYNLVSGEGR